MIPQWVIEKKRDGGVLDDAEIRAFIDGFTTGRIPDYQMSALAMAIYFKGMDERETATLTDAMMRSGDVIDFSAWPRPTADKHSTGGIGDKLSLMIAPLAAAAGLAVPMISGRGLGITGGTLDKLESIPGFNTRLTPEQFKAQIYGDVRCAIIGQTARIAPADKILYALRDVTGTVPSIPLITASIMSKKLAEGAQSLVMDIKCGRGAFMKTLEDAEALALSILRTGQALGRNMAAFITDMDQPLGRTAGNGVEIEETLEVLNGKGPADVRELTLVFAAKMAELSGISCNPEKLLDDGTALAYFYRMVKAQGGNLDALPKAKFSRILTAPRSGYVSEVDADAIGRGVLELGAGRKAVADTLDFAAGIRNLVQAGEFVKAGDPLMEILADSEAKTAPAMTWFEQAVTLVVEPPAPRKLILKTMN